MTPIPILDRVKSWLGAFVRNPIALLLFVAGVCLSLAGDSHADAVWGVFAASIAANSSKPKTKSDDAGAGPTAGSGTGTGTPPGTGDDKGIRATTAH